MLNRPLKLLLFISLTALISLAAIELASRLIFSAKLGTNMLLYGIVTDRAVANPESLQRAGLRWDQIVSTEDAIKDHQSNHYGTYSKYYPHQEKHSKRVHKRVFEEYDIRINNFGFRGEDFSKQKDDNVIRVVALGASSTFGYHDKDDETYPYYLEQVLNQGRLPGKAETSADSRSSGSGTSFEVLNLGIPHLNSNHIRALFLSEVLDLNPDVVTFYEGVNDTRLIKRKAHQRLLLFLGQYSLFVRYVEHGMSAYLESFSQSDVAYHARGRADEFVQNLSVIEQECRKRGILFIVLSQQAKSHIIPDALIDKFSYQAEVAMIRKRLRAGKRIGLNRLQLLIHRDIMYKLDSWARAKQVPYVDIIKRMDEEKKRHCLVSWVHLSPEGNRFIASELSREIRSRLCSSEDGGCRPLSLQPQST